MTNVCLYLIRLISVSNWYSDPYWLQQLVQRWKLNECFSFECVWRCIVQIHNQARHALLRFSTLAVKQYWPLSVSWGGISTRTMIWKRTIYLGWRVTLLSVWFYANITVKLLPTHTSCKLFPMYCWSCKLKTPCDLMYNLDLIWVEVLYSQCLVLGTNTTPCCLMGHVETARMLHLTVCYPVMVKPT